MNSKTIYVAKTVPFLKQLLCTKSHVAPVSVSALALGPEDNPRAFSDVGRYPTAGPFSWRVRDFWCMT